MKALILLLLVTLNISAQTPAITPRRPLGVPADARHFNGRWYKVVLEKKSWHAARDKCKDMGGQLVTVPDAPTWEFVKTLTTASVWLGATDEVTEGVWVWVDGSPVAFSAWYPGQPDNSGSAEHFIAVYKNAWADVPKSGTVGALFQVQGFICEWRGVYPKGLTPQPTTH